MRRARAVCSRALDWQSGSECAAQRTVVGKGSLLAYLTSVCQICSQSLPLCTFVRKLLALTSKSGLSQHSGEERPSKCRQWCSATAARKLSHLPVHGVSRLMIAPAPDAAVCVSSIENGRTKEPSDCIESPPLPNGHIDLANLSAANAGVVPQRPSAAECASVLDYVAAHSSSRKPISPSPNARRRQTFAPTLAPPTSPTSRLSHCQHR
eukprot:6196530-Pleurochrysis_carterae.AAC.1